ncbi:MAG: hypothetical protein RLZZ387_1589 [Chloroflexota bacterium]
MCAYAAYAPVYDSTGQGARGARLATEVLRRLRGRGVAPQDALDLACGTGAATLALADAGLRAVGADRAPAMLAIARGRARDARLDAAFVEADIRDLTLGEEGDAFDLVTCLGALDELADDGDLARVVRVAAGLLRPGGRLAFDLPPAELLAQGEADAVLHDGLDHLVYARLTLDEGARGERQVVWFVREIERWWRGEETHPLRLWAEDEALAALAAAGMALEERWETEGGRVAYVARSEHTAEQR